MKTYICFKEIMSYYVPEMLAKMDEIMLEIYKAVQEKNESYREHVSTLLSNPMKGMLEYVIMLADGELTELPPPYPHNHVYTQIRESFMKLVLKKLNKDIY